MTINNAVQALAVAKQLKTNVVGACQAHTRAYYNAPSAGDFDGDGAADAEDGWKKEPVSARRFDRTGRTGYPASFLGGSHDNGHRAIFSAPGRIRSTDFSSVTKRYSPGVVGEGTVAEIENAMGVTFVGWSTTIDGEQIPPVRRPRIGQRVKEMRRLARHVKATPGTKRFSMLQRIRVLLAGLPKIP